MRAQSVVRSVAAAAVAAVLALAGTQEASAQGFGLDAGVGVDIPMAEMQDAWQVGPSFGLGLVGAVSDRIAVRADGELAFNAGSEFANGNEAPDLTQFRYTGGVEMRFTDPEVENWYTVLGVGAGGASMSTDDFLLPGGQVAEFSETYFTAYGAVRVGYRVSPRVAFSVRSRLYLTTMSRDDSQAFDQLSDGEVNGFEEEWTLPIQLRTELTF